MVKLDELFRIPGDIESLFDLFQGVLRRHGTGQFHALWKSSRPTTRGHPKAAIDAMSSGTTNASAGIASEIKQHSPAA